MKKLFLCIVLFCVASFVFAEVVNLESLNVRALPNDQSEIVGKLKKGDVVDVISTEGEWSKISYNNQDCYVFSAYLAQENSNNSIKPKRTIVGTIGNILKIIIFGFLSIVFFLYEPIKSLMITLGFGDFATIVALLAELIFFFVVFILLRKGITQGIAQCTTYRCSACRKIGALKYTGQSEIVDSWTSSEVRNGARYGTSGKVIGSQDQYVTVTKEKIRELYICKYCGNKVFFTSTSTKE